MFIDKTKVYSKLCEVCESVVEKSNGGFNARCPVCGDSKKSPHIKRLHIDYYNRYDDWIVKCYNGGCPLTSSTNFIKFYSMAKGVSYTRAKKEIYDRTFDIDKIKSRIKRKKSIEKRSQTSIDEIELPTSVISLDDNPDSRILKRYKKELSDFVSSRYIDQNVYKCYICYDDDYKNRVILPIYINGKLRYFQGRAINGIEPKYKNPEIDKTGIYLNVDRVSKNKDIIFTEGLIDAMMVEDNQGTSYLGSYISDDMISAFKELTDEKIILCFDNPLVDDAAFTEMSKFVQESKYRSFVRYFLPNTDKFKDLNELKIIDPHINIYDYVLKNSYSLYALRSKIKLLYKYNI